MKLLREVIAQLEKYRKPRLKKKDIITLGDLKQMVSQAVSTHGRDAKISGPTMGMEYGSMIDGFGATTFEAMWDGAKFVPNTYDQIAELLTAEESFDLDEPGDTATTLSQFASMVDKALASYGDIPVIGPTYGADYGGFITGIQEIGHGLLEVGTNESAYFSSWVDESVNKEEIEDKDVDEKPTKYNADGYATLDSLDKRDESDESELNSQFYKIITSVIEEDRLLQLRVSKEDQEETGEEKGLWWVESEFVLSSKLNNEEYERLFDAFDKFMLLNIFG